MTLDLILMQLDDGQVRGMAKKPKNTPAKTKERDATNSAVKTAAKTRPPQHVVPHKEVYQNYPSIMHLAHTYTQHTGDF